MSGTAYVPVVSINRFPEADILMNNFPAIGASFGRFAPAPPLAGPAEPDGPPAPAPHVVAISTATEPAFMESVRKQVGPVFAYPNMVMAGGMVSLLLDATLNPNDFPNSDVDYFIYGGGDAARNTLAAVLAALHRLYGNYAIDVVHSTVTVTVPALRRKLQFIVMAKEYSTVAHVLGGFDMDHVRVAFDGFNVFVTDTAWEAIASKQTAYTVGLSDKWRRSVRIFKALQRGYRVVIEDALVDTGAILRDESVLRFCAYTYLEEMQPGVSMPVGFTTQAAAIEASLNRVDWAGLGSLDSGYGRGRGVEEPMLNLRDAFPKMWSSISSQ